VSPEYAQTTDTVQLRQEMSASYMVRLGSIVLLMGMCLIAILTLGFEVRTRLAALERANSDNTQWVMMQAEVEALRLQTAVLEAQRPGTDIPGALDEVRRWFNVFYSRVGMLEESTIYGPLMVRPAYAPQHQIFRKFLDTTVSTIDGSDGQLMAALPDIAQRLPELRAAARSMTLKALSDFAAQSDQERDSISETLVRLAILTAALIFVLAGLAIMMSRLYGRSVAQAEEVRQTGARLATIFATSADGIVVTDTNGLIQEFNPAAQAIFGWSRSEAMGKKALDLLYAETTGEAQRSQLTRAMQAINGGSGPLRIEVDGKRADGQGFPAEVSVASARGPGRNMVVAFVRDISDRRKTQRDLNLALESAVAGERAKAQFLAVMSHEMRTPLNGLIGSMDLMSETPLNAEQRDLLRVMETSGAILLSHVNSVLDISRAESGAIRVQSDSFDLDRLVEDVVANQAGLAAASGNTIGIVPVSGQIGRVVGDSGRIGQILLNLIGNAVKFTGNGTITVETERLPDESSPHGGPMVEFRVIDSGIGIPDEDVDRIFEDFVTLDSSYGRTAGGTGLGLGIARRLAEAMEGEIGAESVEGEGSLFWLRLPLPPAAGQQAPAPIPIDDAPEQALSDANVPDIPPMSVLVVEDNEINRFLLRRYLEGAGHGVTEAVDGLEGVSMAAAQYFDVILMDISMPRMDGIEATKRIRDGGGKSAKSRILALTAHALPEEQARFRKAGMECCLTKPIGRPDLLRALARQYAPHSPDRQVNAEAPVVDLPTLHELTRQIGAETASLLISRLLAEGDAMLVSLEAARAAGEWDDIARQCHKLGGACGTFGTRQLRLALAAVEDAARHERPDAMDGMISELQLVWAETRRQLETEAAALVAAA
jgi:PAS domain S-box-containing protein